MGRDGTRRGRGCIDPALILLRTTKVLSPKLIHLAAGHLGQLVGFGFLALSLLPLGMAAVAVVEQAGTLGQAMGSRRCGGNDGARQRSPYFLRTKHSRAGRGDPNGKAVGDVSDLTVGCTDRRLRGRRPVRRSVMRRRSAGELACAGDVGAACHPLAGERS